MTERQITSSHPPIARENYSIKTYIQESLLSISSSFATCENTDESIKQCLAIIGELCEASRSSVFQFIEHGTLISNTHEWCRERVKSKTPMLQCAPLSSFPWWMEQLMKRNIIRINDISTLPPEASAEKKTFESLGISSILSSPIFIKKELIGFVSIENDAGLYSWQQSDMSFMRVVADIMGFVLERQAADVCLKEYSNEVLLYKGELRSLEQMKDEFLSNVSHELKTPLISIKGYTELLHDHVLGYLNAQQEKAVVTILHNSSRLEHLINSLLYISSVHLGDPKYKFSLANIENLLNRAIESAVSHTRKQGVEIITDIQPDMPDIYVDETKISGVFSRLIENGLKFTPSSGTVSLRAFADNEELHVSIADTGVGIPTEYLEQLCELFFQVDGSEARKYGGIGAGLYICKQVVIAHKGIMWAESEEGKGSVFHVILPFQYEV
ncbi:GAF domain-containing sensor histidine kinase [uncultured Methanomethylovorans sp.]|uniref:GAF domain-containing sensor histidine kinase n=1 Tax=uncultured Methanomethylovorans sp. TaxID=183759 RepID=UPI002AA79962|nr:GAF domain-containing sensor histidine kinase [uncultured Methanomethylovorans sp.]